MKTHLLLTVLVIVLGVITGLVVEGDKQEKPNSKPVSIMKYDSTLSPYKMKDVEAIDPLERLYQQVARQKRESEKQKYLKLREAAIQKAKENLIAAEKKKLAEQRRVKPRQVVVSRSKSVDSNTDSLSKVIQSYGVDPARADHYSSLATYNGTKHGIDPLWLVAMMYQESRFNSQAVSSHGAVGLMQILPRTGSIFGVNRNQLFEPGVSVSVSAQYLSKLTAETGNLRMATIAYNQGIGNVNKGTYRTWYYNEVNGHYSTMKQRLNR